MSRLEKNAIDYESDRPSAVKRRKRVVYYGLSLDGWAVVVAIALGACVYFGAKVTW